MKRKRIISGPKTGSLGTTKNCAHCMHSWRNNSGTLICACHHSTHIGREVEPYMSCSCFQKKVEQTGCNTCKYAKYRAYGDYICKFEQRDRIVTSNNICEHYDRKTK